MAHYPSYPYNAYGYIPDLPANIVACVLFGIVLLIQLGFGAATQDWWMFVTWGITAGLELTGYIARALSHKYVNSFAMFKMQLVCLILAPAFMAAGIYYQLAKEITIYGKRYSPLKPMIYTAICTTCDVIALVVQGVGGGKAAGDVGTAGGPATGGWVMVAGIAFQVLTLGCFTLLFGLVTWRIYSDPNREQNWNPEFSDTRRRPLFKFWLPAVAVSLLFLLIRSIYRIVELSEGWSGYLMQTERFFLILDGLMILLGMVPLCIIYPAVAYGYVPIEGLHYKEGGTPRKQKHEKTQQDPEVGASRLSEPQGSMGTVSDEKNEASF